VLFLGVGLAVAGAVNYALYAAEPDLYRTAYLFELRGTQFEDISDPLIRLGRFGLDPRLAGRTVIELIREAPFLMVLCGMGAAVALASPLSVPPAYWVWLVGVTGFMLLQNFQPIRYFELASPAYCVFAAIAIHALVQGAHTVSGAVWNRAQAAVMAVYVVFNFSYLGMNAVANEDNRLRTVRAWVLNNTAQSDRIVAAGYFCTDLPNRAYAHYRLGGSNIDELAVSLDSLDIDYVVFDSGEWAPRARAELARRYETVVEWPFGAVFRVSQPGP
jgi:hypothetical protein